MITIVDYGLGNLGSIINMLQKLGHHARVTSNPAEVSDAHALILPGVGSFDNGMQNLRRLGLDASLTEAVRTRGTPILGICLGAQLMTRGSEEGSAAGLGWIDANTIRFFNDGQYSLKVPAMGWLDVTPCRAHWILAGSSPNSRYYFVHAYHFRCDHQEDVLLEARYGYTYPAAFAVNNMIGVQFHPEKSHKYGMSLLNAFANYAKIRVQCAE
jgi:glutamine amidotransferase